MRPDMRYELVADGAQATRAGLTLRQAEEVAARVLDSISPGSYKLDEKTWVRLEVAECNCDEEAYRRGKYHFDGCLWSREPKYVYTEVDHAELPS